MNGENHSNKWCTISDFLSLKSLKYDIVKQDNDRLTISLLISAKPGAKINKIEISSDGLLQISLNKRPIKGEANIGLQKILSKLFAVPKTSIELRSGEKSKKKLFLVHFYCTDAKNVGYYVKKIKESFSKL